MGILSVLLLLAYFTLHTQPPLTLPNDEPWNLPKESIGAMIYFKEESHALIESLLHLYSQGFEHIRLVDNGSKRELPLEALEMLEKKGLVNLRKDTRTSVQKWVTFKAFQWLRLSSDWILPVDADEFPHATRMGSLLNYLVLKDDEVCSIALPMFFFGSSGRKEQPNSILQGFTRRRDFSVHGEPILGYKTVSRPRCSMWSAIHHAAPFPWKRLRSYNSNVGLPRNGKPASDQSTEKNIPDVAINHYRTQSEYFYKVVKCIRGNGTRNGKQRTMGIFHHNNKEDNALLDERLAKLSRQRFPSLYGKITDDEASSLAFQSNMPLTNPWPMKNIIAAFHELRRHQGLVIVNAADSGFPDQFGRALRNVAMLDITWDCIVRVPHGHAVTLAASGLTKLCATREHRQGSNFSVFVQETVDKYKSKYGAFVAMDGDVMLPEGVDTSRFREDAQKMSTSATVPILRLEPKSFEPVALLAT